MSAFSYLDHLACSRCNERHDARVRQGLCRSCGSPLLARYDLAAVVTKPGDLVGRRNDLWRYHELLPVSGPERIVTLGEGMTPLLTVPALAADLGLKRLLIKDDGLLPTGSFKARGAAVGVSRARELGASRLAMPTNGNAGAAWAAYATRAGLDVVVAMPLDAPPIAGVEIAVAGGDLRLIDGLISDAGRMIAEAVASSDDDWFDVATSKEPYRIEGKKTMAFEIVEQLGWRMPDVIVYPTGGGVGMIGIHKAVEELRELGWVSGPPPRLVCVQSTGCAPIVKAYDGGAAETEPWPDARTVAFGLTVPKPLADFLVLEAIYETGGTAVAVDDSDLLDDVHRVGGLEGLFLSPEGAATVTATRALLRSGWIKPEDEVVLLNTGAGLIYPGTIDVAATPIIASDGTLSLS